jgi:hypothetical protein
VQNLARFHLHAPMLCGAEPRIDSIYHLDTWVPPAVDSAWRGNVEFASDLKGTGEFGQEAAWRRTYFGLQPLCV